MKDKSTQHDGSTFEPNFSDIHSFTTHTISTTSSSQTETNLFMPKTLNKISKQSIDACEHIDANVVRIQLGKKESDTTSSNGISTQTDNKSSLSGESSSIPSSYERHSDLNSTVVLQTTENKKDEHDAESNQISFGSTAKSKVETPLETDDIPPLRRHFAIPVFPSSSPSHNRSRRGGIIPKESDAVVHAAATLNKPRAPVLIIPPPPLLDLQNFSTNDFMKSPDTDRILVNSNAIGELEIQPRVARNDSSTHAQLQSMPDSIMRVSISS